MRHTRTFVPVDGYGVPVRMRVMLGAMEPNRKFRKCPRCQREDPPEGFYGNGYCKPCGAEYYRKRRDNPETRARIQQQQRDAYQRNPEKAKAYARDYARKLKLAALEQYGTVCVCCGENQYEFLAIDHIRGEGRKHRESIGVSPGAGFYRWLQRENYPDGFRVLCHNCNVASFGFGRCPHPGGVIQGSTLRADP